jgi:hypothetical protein
MNPERDHPFEHLDWRADVMNTCLDGPRPESRRLDPRLHSDRQILMPGNAPVRFGRLVKQQGADGSGTVSQDGPNQFEKRLGPGEVSDFGEGSKRIPHPIQRPVATKHILRITEAVDRTPDRLNLVSTNDSGDDREAVAFEVGGGGGEHRKLRNVEIGISLRLTTRALCPQSHRRVEISHKLRHCLEPRQTPLKRACNGVEVVDAVIERGKRGHRFQTS